LGDRIAIMSHGRLRCVGSPLFLKKAYGVGYQLTIEKRAITAGDLRESVNDEHKSKEAIDGDTTAAPTGQEVDHTLSDIVKSSVPEATCLRNSSTEMSYQLPMGSASRFALMFKGLDEEVDKGTVFSYGLSITTIVRISLITLRDKDYTTQVPLIFVVSS
jgi:hypothetical protein